VLGAAAPACAAPSIRTGYPADSVAYEGEDARALARQVLPAAAESTVGASVDEAVSLPGGGHYGISVTLMQPMQLAEDSVCIEPVTIVMLNYDGSDQRTHDLALDFSGGTLPQYSYSQTLTRARFRQLTDKPASPEAALDACRAAPRQDGGWSFASDLGEAKGFARQRRHFVNALPSLPKVGVRCVGTSLPVCDYGKAELVAFLTRNLPVYSMRSFLLGRGGWLTFSWHEPADPGFINTYDVTVDLDAKDSYGDVRLAIRRTQPVEF
jgi:hypothetical protein